MATENISRIASDFQSQLSSSVAPAATSFTVQSVLDNKGGTLSNGIYCFTIDRDNSAKEYLIGQLDNTTGIVSTISSISPQGVLTANAQSAHRIGANVIISDHSILSAISRIFTGQGTISPASPLEYTTAPTLSSATQIATKGYVDSVVTGGTIDTDRIILGSQTAGETIVVGNIVYFKSSDSRWWLADADLTVTFSNVQLGVALGSGTAGNTISGGVQIYGKCDSFTGLTATATYFLSNTAGAVATSAGTNSVVLGQAFSATGILFNPDTIQASISQVPTGSITMYSSSAAPSGWLNCDGTAVSRTTYINLFAVTSTTYGVGDGSTTFNVPDLRSRFPLGYSVSAPTKAFTFSSRASNVITVTGATAITNNELQTGQAVVYVTSGSVITGLTSSTTYYLIRISSTTFSLATSIANANAGTAIALSSDGSGTQTFTATYTARALGDQGGEENHSLTDAQAPSHTHTIYTQGSNTRTVTYATANVDSTGDTPNTPLSSDAVTAAGSDEAHNIMPLFTVVNYIIKT